MIALDTSLLTSFYNARAGVGTGAAAASAARSGPIPTSPWSSRVKQLPQSEQVKAALSGKKFIDESKTLIDQKGASDNYKKLFTLYNGIERLKAITTRINEANVPQAEQTLLKKRFKEGMAEVTQYFGKLQLDKAMLVQGNLADLQKMSVAIQKANGDAKGAVVHVGKNTDSVKAFEGPMKFSAQVTRLNGSTGTVDFDLAEMGTRVRTMDNVVGYLNGKLASAGMQTRFSVDKITAEAVEQKPGMPIPPARDQFSLSIKGGTGEKMSLSATDTAEGLILAQKAGKIGSESGTLAKFVTDTVTGTTAPQIPQALGGETDFVSGRVFNRSLADSITTVRATKAGTDGSIYVLADVGAKINGQAIKGEQDVALIKYDSAGNVLYTRTLGAAGKASGLSFDIASDGKVAVTGTVKGDLDSTLKAGRNDEADHFVTVFDAKGDELWTRSQRSSKADEGVSVAFGTDGRVHVSGRTQGMMPGSTTIPAAGWDNFVSSYEADGDLQGTTIFGSAGEDQPGAMTLNGNTLYVAGSENGHGVIRSFDVSGTKPALISTRDLGPLTGGISAIAVDGGKLVIAGNTRNPALGIATVTRAHSGGVDQFAAKLNLDLAATPDETLAYFGSNKDEGATVATISGGKVWFAGQSNGEIAGIRPLVTLNKDAKDAYVARVNIDNGAVEWTKRFSGKDEIVAPQAIAVMANGVSALDRLGLGSGEVGRVPDTKLLTAVTSVRAGDQFFIQNTKTGSKTKVEIAANETLESLQKKVASAAGFRAKVEIDSKTTDGTSRLKISSVSRETPIALVKGPVGRDALEALGFVEGTLQAKPANTKVKVDPSAGLNLPSDLTIDNKLAVKEANLALTGAQSSIRSFFNKLINPDAGNAKAISGTAPAYLTKQISRYQDALNRLGG